MRIEKIYKGICPVRTCGHNNKGICALRADYCIKREKVEQRARDIEDSLKFAEQELFSEKSLDKCQLNN